MICYNSRDIFHKKPFGAVPVGTKVSFSVSFCDLGDAVVTGACLVIAREGCEEETVWGVRRDSTWDDREKFTCGNMNEISYDFHWEALACGLYFYFFRGEYGFGQREASSSHQLTVYEQEAESKEGFTWLSHGLMYQIFPDRFARSKAYEPPHQNKSYVMHDRWGELPVHEPDENGIVWNNDFFGGNLRGIEEKLDDLQSLGVTVLYLNPIFEAFSNHRYDTGNYLAIDPMLGTEEDFSRLCKEAETRGMRVIFDGVFNHTGSDSLYFNRFGRYPEVGAFQSKESPYYSWYHFTQHPQLYESWWGIDTLPSLNETDPGVLDFLVEGEDSVVRHWLRAGASGVRLDVADELPDVFLDALRQAVKKEKEDALIIGEVWEDASNKMAYGQRRRYFQGKQLDSVMNYPLKDAIIRFIGYDHNAVGFGETVEQLWENYPVHVFNSLMNILGTHDTKRILTVFKESGGSEIEARQKLFSALLIWAFMPGIPCLYYGDELGMEGDRDPLNRQCFCPSRADEEITVYYRKVLGFRRRIEGIQQMAFAPVQAQGGYYAFERRGEDKRLLIAVNDGDESVSISAGQGSKVLDLLISGTVHHAGQNQFEVTAKSGLVLWIADSNCL